MLKRDWKDERVTASLKSNTDTWLSPGQQTKCISRSETLQPFPPAEHCSKFLPSREMRSESRAGKGTRGTNWLHRGGGFQNLPFPNRNRAPAGVAGSGLESRESGVISHHTEGSERPKNPSDPKGLPGVCCGSWRAL